MTRRESTVRRLIDRIQTDEFEKIVLGHAVRDTLNALCETVESQIEHAL